MELAEMDLDIQERAHRDDTYENITKVLNLISELGVFPSLVWVYVWDIVRDNLDTYHAEAGDEYYKINPNMTEKDIFNLFWEDADKNGFSLEYGTESLHEHVFDWMTERDILVPTEDWVGNENN